MVFSRGTRAGTRVLAAVGLVLAASIAMTGCTDDKLAADYKSGSGKNYIAGDGTVTEIATADRKDPVSFSGTTESGDSFDSADHTGEVLVVNFWYAACAPCRAEAPDLQSLNEKFDGEATFVGVNVRDQAATAESFEKTYGVTYPAIIDAGSGAAQLAFAGSIPPNAVPTTLVLDKQHRVAARILGQLDGTSILSTLIADTVAEAE